MVTNDAATPTADAASTARIDRRQARRPTTTSGHTR
jgi:hypothetical protein